MSGSRERTAITVELDAWAHAELEREAAERETTPAELIAYAVAYYLADRDSPRMARRTLPRGPRGEPPAPGPPP